MWNVGKRESERGKRERERRKRERERERKEHVCRKFLMLAVAPAGDFFFFFFFFFFEPQERPERSKSGLVLLVDFLHKLELFFFLPTRLFWFPSINFQMSRRDGSFLPLPLVPPLLLEIFQDERERERRERERESRKDNRTDLTSFLAQVSKIAD